MKGMRLLAGLGWSLLALAIVAWMPGSAQAAGEIGKTIDKANVQEYKDVLFPALYRAVERGDFILPTANLPFEYKLDGKFLSASEKNAGKFDVNAAGDLIDKSTGKLPKKNIYGLPFPRLDRNDPNIAVKIMWNFNFQKYRFMGTRAPAHISWISQNAGEHRWMDACATLLYFQGREPGYELNNPYNYLSMEAQAVNSPMSIKGTNTMAWDYFDERDITQFAYIPAFRRVRQTSGASRSDPYQGTDAWLDLTFLWSGKNRSMKWRLLGERTILVPFTSLKKDSLEEHPDGSVRRHIALSKWGFNTPGWKGAQWAPTSVTWVPRRVWIIEQIPKDPYYAWGGHTNYVDKETYVIWSKEVNDKAEEFRTWVLYFVHYGETSHGRNDVGDWDVLLMIDEKARHGSKFERLPDQDNDLYLPASKLDASFFTQSNFLQMSK